MIFLLTRRPSPFAVLSLLLICTCAYLHQIFPTILDRNKQGYVRTGWLAGWSAPETAPRSSNSFQLSRPTWKVLCSAANRRPPYRSLMGIFWKAARIGERLSPYISLCCVFMAVSLPRPPPNPLLPLSRHCRRGFPPSLQLLPPAPAPARLLTPRLRSPSSSATKS